MTEGMKQLLESIVTSSRAQIRELEVQIKNINGLLYVANDKKSQCCTEAGVGYHLPGCVYYYKGD